MFGLKNPIPPCYEETEDVTRFWKQANGIGKLVPYYGNHDGASHGFLRFLRDITELSPSFRACLTWMKRYAFGGVMGTVDIVEKPIPGYELNREESLPEDDKDKFIEFLASIGITPVQFAKYTCPLFQHFRESGNAYLRVRIVKVGDDWRVSFKPLHYRRVCYEWTKPGENRSLVYSESWRFVDGQFKGEKYPASYVGEDYNWRKVGDVWETVVHVANFIDESDWYGRPDIGSVVDWMFSEHKLGEHSCKVNSTEMTSKGAFAFKREYYDEETDCDHCEGQGSEKCDCGSKKRQTPFQKKVRVLRTITTNEGDYGQAKSLAALEYDEDAPTWYSMQINRDSKWFEVQIKEAAARIHSVEGVPRELTKTEMGKSGLGGNQLANLFVMTDSDTVAPVQNEWETFWSDVLNNVCEVIERDDMKEYGIKFKDRITPVVQNLKMLNGKQENTTDPERDN